MTKLTRVRIIISSIVTILFAMFSMVWPQYGAPLITLVMAIALMVTGIHALFYYVTMARYMVNGQMILCKGILYFNTGVFLLDLTDIPLHYIMVYLLIGHGFTGAATLLRSLESRRMAAASWRRGFFMGFGNLLISVLCLVFINNADIMVYVYCLSLIGSSITSISTAMKKTAMVYIQ